MFRFSKNKCLTFVQIKKRDCVLLFRFTRLWYCPLFRTSNTEVHAEYVSTRVYLIKYTRHKIYISWGHQLLQCLGIKIEFTRFRKAKNKALRTLTHLKGKSSPFWRLYTKCLESRDWGLFQTSWLSERGHFPPPKPRRWTFDCKYTTIFWIDQALWQKS